MIPLFANPQVRIFAHLWLCLLISCSNQNYKNPHIEIQTKLGDIEIELYRERAPATVAAILSSVDSGFYKNTSFYRVLNLGNQPSGQFKAELIQGGMWGKNRKKAEQLPAIPHETTEQTKILHTNGIVSLARMAPGTAKSEFFICIGDQPGFDFGGENNADGQGYAAFGKVVKGMDVVKRISDEPEDDQAFDPPVLIFDIVRKRR